MSTFETPTTGQPPAEPYPVPQQHGGREGASEPDTYVSPLELLAREIDERESAEEELLPVEVPKLGIRLMCSTRISGKEWQAWQKRAIPQARRRKATALDLDQVELMCTVLVETCEHIEFRRGPQGSGEWAVMPGNDGEPMTLKSDELLRRFNQMDSASMVMKLFGNDAALLKAGQEVVDAAGWGDGESENPTE